MRYALISDIHGNLEALNTVLKEIEKERPDSLICLGDVIGYGANPEECAAIIRDAADVCIMGNHEAAVVGTLDINYFTPYARAAAEWTRQQVSQETMKWAFGLPLAGKIDDFTVVHGSLFQPEMFNYVQTIADAEYNFKAMETPLLFLGHSHQPLAFFNTSPMTYTLGPDIELNFEEKNIVNIGSVGQPRDENPLAAFAIYDSEEKMVRLHRVQYDVETAAAKIRDAKLPEALAMRLYVGR
ncbi:MAG: metallophosphoesterase family protein [Planctomycetes bacterium]|nr:metallophosphoesterase family protein [Planctomycetota bacterium]